MMNPSPVRPEDLPTLAELARGVGQPGGIVCPRCGCRDWRVYYTRQRADAVLRSKVCRHCGMKIITNERPIQ